MASSSSKSAPEKNCPICNGPGARSFYKGKACPSCRVFFTRAVSRDEPYVCQHNQNCEIRFDSRANCKACRFALCLKAQLTAGTVGRFKTQDEQAIVPHFTRQQINYQTALLSSALSAGYFFVDSLKKMKTVSMLASELLALERICENPQGPIPVGSSCYTLEANFGDVLINSCQCCKRVNLGWDTALTDLQTDLIKLMYCRLVTLYADFISGCPEFYQLDGLDKLRFAKHNYYPILLFTKAYRGWKMRLNTMAPPFDYSDQNNVYPTETTEFYIGIGIYVAKHVMAVFEELQTSNEEYALLKMIVMFTPSIILSDNAMDILCRARSKYICSLSELIKEIYPEYSREMITSRLSKMLGILRPLQQVSSISNQYSTRMVLLNFGGIRCKVAYDIHVNV